MATFRVLLLLLDIAARLSGLILVFLRVVMQHVAGGPGVATAIDVSGLIAATAVLITTLAPKQLFSRNEAVIFVILLYVISFPLGELSNIEYRWEHHGWKNATGLNLIELLIMSFLILRARSMKQK